MSFVIVSAESLTRTVSDLTRIGSMINAANAAAVAPTIELTTAAADEVSEHIAALFSAHSQAYQSLSVEAVAFHNRFVQALTAGGGAYAAAESANAAALQILEQQLFGVINAPTQLLLERPLIGSGANGQTINGVGQPGGAGGILFGDGGRGGDSTAPGVA
ncbi:PE family protein, partial [Mycobacterium szulgai]